VPCCPKDDDVKLKGRVALVTGSASGIGEATATTLAREGASVVVVDVNEADGKRVVAEIEAAGGTGEFFCADVGLPAELEGMVDFALRRFGRLDILHNNAVFSPFGRVGEIELDGWQKALNVGLTGYWYATKLALVPMLAQGSGVIVNTASIAGLAAEFNLGAYNTLKAGVISLTRSTGIEYARKGIRCNAVCPGPILTNAFRGLDDVSPGVIERTASAIPMGRFGEPQEIANVALFLASDDASFVTGAHFVADGGLHAHDGLPSLWGPGADW
jgi:meso-butanediol dehydrogenase / (S,S)-butanediol dehydrogenase / diacetyl reductase